VARKLFETAKQQERAVLVGVITPDETEEQENEYLDELAFLVETAGGQTIKNFTQKVLKPDSKTFVGKGKIEEVRDYVKAEEADMVIFDDELTPSQIRNLEKYLECKILDRSNLILDIFAKRAKTAQAKTQVELAQFQYLLPRLTRMWTHLSKQKGGIGMKGPGETEIETDRRIVRDRIALLKEKLKEIEKQTITQRKNRVQLVRVALVGYTNVGKSTIMNVLSKSDVFAENKLFATLDTTVRKVVIDNLPFLLSDTVGFIRKLPHHLIECFKSTLDEVHEADILIHVVDVSHPNFEDHIRVVNETLKELNSLDKPVITVFNKVDAYKNEEGKLTIADFKRSWMNKNNAPAIFISALKKENIDEFRALLYKMIKDIHTERYPYDKLLY
jgi:GTPase